MSRNPSMKEGTKGWHRPLARGGGWLGPPIQQGSRRPRNINAPLSISSGSHEGDWASGPRCTPRREALGKLKP